MPKKKEISEIDRRTKLTLAIEKHYANAPFDFVEHLVAFYEVTITDMFTLSEARKGGWQITHLFNDAVFEPVTFPKVVRDDLRKDDVFLLTMGLKAGEWEVIYMSPPYETMHMDEQSTDVQLT